MERSSSSEKFPLGSTLPSFRLQDAFGATVDTSYFAGAKGALVVFTCNHCPYVKGTDVALLEVIRPAYELGLRAVLISANDPEKYPDDGVIKMREKAEALDLPCPYLFDETQDVARRFDAQCTPECFLFDERLALVFHGAINDSPRDATRVTRSFLADAVDEVLQGRSPSTQFAHPLGCSIKWK